jgi:hypothetical protein
LDDLLAAPLGGLRDGLGLQHARCRGIGGDGLVERGGPVAERLVVDEERVVRRPVDRRPRAGGHRVPAGTGVRRCLGEHAVPAGLRAGAQHLRETRDHRASLAGVLLDEVLPHASAANISTLSREFPWPPPPWSPPAAAAGAVIMPATRARQLTIAGAAILNRR